MAISAKEVKALRDRTGAGMMDCKRALEETNGDTDAAIDLLRTRGAARAAKRAERTAGEGTIGSYIHFDGRTGVLVEVNCETDFVAKTEDFRQLAKDLAIHIASANPLAVSPDRVPDDVVEHERKIYLEQARNEGKPDHIQEKIVEGRLRKFYQEQVLLEQAFVKDSDRTIQDLVTEVSARTGEKIKISRFVRFQVGENPW
jgi:elongation factor Ts